MRRLFVILLILLMNCFSYCSSSDEDFVPQKKEKKAYPVDPNWSEILPENSPKPRYDHGMIYFPLLNGLVLFGGRNCDTGEYFNDTWLFKNGKWTVLNTQNSPSPRYRFGIAYDSKREKIVIYGGANSNFETWEFDGYNWSMISTLHHPNSLGGHGMTFFTKIGKTVLFGGVKGDDCYNETWIYDGVDWVKLNLEGTIPEKRMSTDMVYDPDNKNVFLFGGQYGADFFNDSWSFDGIQWVKISTQHKPSPRSLHKMVFNAYSSRIVLFGGVRNYLNDTWEFYNNDWINISTVNKPSERGAMALAYYPSPVPSVILFGGINVIASSPYTKGDTWKYSSMAQGTAPSISIKSMIFLVACLSLLIYLSIYNRALFEKFFHSKIVTIHISEVQEAAEVAASRL